MMEAHLVIVQVCKSCMVETALEQAAMAQPAHEGCQRAVRLWCTPVAPPLQEMVLHIHLAVKI